MSINPGETIWSRASMVRLAVAPIKGPIAAIVSPLIAMFVRRQGFPVPSITRPLRMRTSYWAGHTAAAASKTSMSLRILSPQYTRIYAPGRRRRTPRSPGAGRVLQTLPAEKHWPACPETQGDRSQRRLSLLGNRMTGHASPRAENQWDGIPLGRQRDNTRLFTTVRILAFSLGRLWCSCQIRRQALPVVALATLTQETAMHSPKTIDCGRCSLYRSPAALLPMAPLGDADHLAALAEFDRWLLAICQMTFMLALSTGKTAAAARATNPNNNVYSMVSCPSCSQRKRIARARPSRMKQLLSFFKHLKYHRARGWKRGTFFASTNSTDG